MTAISIRYFADRQEAGRKLAEDLSGFSGRIDTLVLALPRGGVPVAAEVAKALSLPLDIWLVRKLGMPGNEEVAVGAIAAGGTAIFNEHLIHLFCIDPMDIHDTMEREQRELNRRNTLYRQGRAAPDVMGKTILIIDDGLATGATMKAAVAALRLAGAVWIVAAAPVGSPAACRELAAEADEVVCPLQPESFSGVGQWYEDFSQTTDSEVLSILKRPPEMGAKSAHL